MKERLKPKIPLFLVWSEWNEEFSKIAIFDFSLVWKHGLRTSWQLSSFQVSSFIQSNLSSCLHDNIRNIRKVVYHIYIILIVAEHALVYMILLFTLTWNRNWQWSNDWKSYYYECFGLFAVASVYIFHVCKF